MQRPEQYITHVYNVVKNETETAVEIYTERTGIEIHKRHGNYYILIEEVFTDEPTSQISLYFKYIGYGSLSFLGNINGKVKEQLRYKTAKIQKETENLILKLHYTNKEKSEAIQHIYKQHGKPKTPIGILRDKVFYN
tara:strand:- start:1303 stop:1713 length:411 start_codon:yes stop_codon:yes gene_type:complete